MKKDEVAALAAGKDDVDLAAVARKFGALPLACDFDSVDIGAEGHSSKQFSTGNPFVHLAIREGHVSADVRDISALRKFNGEEVNKSLGADDEEMPIHQTIFSDTPPLI